MMKVTWVLIAVSVATPPLVAPTVAAQEPVHWDVASRIRHEGFERSRVMDYAGHLTDVIGPRLTGSPNMRQAQGWAMGQLEDMGLSGVQREPWGNETVSWDIERISVHMLEPDYQMIIAYPLAYTPGTDGKIVARAVIATIRAANDFERYRGKLANAVVLATPPMPMEPRFVQDAFRHTEESLHVFETEGSDLLLERHARGQPQQRSFRPAGLSEAEVEAFYRSEGVLAGLEASIGGDCPPSPSPQSTTTASIAFSSAVSR